MTQTKDPLRLLAIGAHPADVFDQSGGTMAHHVQRGDWVGAIVLTHGARVHDKVVSDDMFHRQQVPDASELSAIMAERAGVKCGETIRACEILGMKKDDLYFLGADDAVLLPEQTLIRRLAGMIRQLKPDIIVTHYPLESDGVASPHAITGQITLHAMQLAAAVDPGDRRPPHRVAQVFFFGIGAAAVRSHVWGAIGGFTNDVFIDISDVVQKKLAAIDAMVSQGYGGAYARKRIETSDGSFGQCVELPYAEGFISMRSSTHYHLPLSDYDLGRARLSDHEAIARRSFRVKTEPPVS